MKKILPIFVLLFVVAIANAEFSVTALNIDFNVQKDGSVNAIETVDILISGTNDIFNYTNHLNNSDVASWMDFLGTNLLTLHVDRTYVKISDIVIRPQPIRNFNPVQEKANGKIIITYNIAPYYTEQSTYINILNPENNTGLFLVNNLKPRVKQLELNEKALSFVRSSSGYIMLDDRTTLNFIFPEGTQIIDANPPPGYSDTSSGKYLVAWTGMILPNFALKTEHTETIVDEINTYFSSKIKGIQSYISTDQGKIMVGMILLILGFIFFLSTKKPITNKGGES